MLSKNVGTVILVSAVGVGATATGTYIYKEHKKQTTNQVVVDPVREIKDVKGDVSSGTLPFESPEELKDRLQKKVDDSMLAIKINANPMFESSESEGTLAIENNSNNKYKFQVEITLDDSGKTIYTSPVVNPGEYIMNDKLDEKLSNGIYNATARFYAYNDNDEFIGQAGAGLKIQIGE